MRMKIIENPTDNDFPIMISFLQLGEKGMRLGNYIVNNKTHLMFFRKTIEESQFKIIKDSYIERRLYVVGA